MASISRSRFKKKYLYERPIAENLALKDEVTGHHATMGYQERGMTTLIMTVMVIR